MSDDLGRGTHISNITKKANQSIGFLKRNIKTHKHEIKSTAYKTLIRSQLENAGCLVGLPLLLANLKCDQIAQKLTLVSIRPETHKQSPCNDVQGHM